MSTEQAHAEKLTQLSVDTSQSKVPTNLSKSISSSSKQFTNQQPLQISLKSRIPRPPRRKFDHQNKFEFYDKQDDYQNRKQHYDQSLEQKENQQENSQYQKNVVLNKTEEESGGNEHEDFSDQFNDENVQRQNYMQQQKQTQQSYQYPAKKSSLYQQPKREKQQPQTNLQKTSQQVRDKKLLNRSVNQGQRIRAKKGVDDQNVQCQNEQYQKKQETCSSRYAVKKSSYERQLQGKPKQQQQQKKQQKSQEESNKLAPTPFSPRRSSSARSNSSLGSQRELIFEQSLRRKSESQQGNQRILKQDRSVGQYAEKYIVKQQYKQDQNEDWNVRPVSRGSTSSAHNSISEASFTQQNQHANINNTKYVIDIQQKPKQASAEKPNIVPQLQLKKLTVPTTKEELLSRSNKPKPSGYNQIHREVKTQKSATKARKTSTSVKSQDSNDPYDMCTQYVTSSGIENEMQQSGHQCISDQKSLQDDVTSAQNTPPRPCKKQTYNVSLSKDLPFQRPSMIESHNVVTSPQTLSPQIPLKTSDRGDETSFLQSPPNPRTNNQHVEQHMSRCDILNLEGDNVFYTPSSAGEEDQGWQNLTEAVEKGGMKKKGSVQEFVELERACKPDIASYPVIEDDHEEFFSPQDNRFCIPQEVSNQIEERAQHKGRILDFNDHIDESQLDEEIHKLSLDLDMQEPTDVHKQTLTRSWLDNTFQKNDDIDKNKGSVGESKSADSSTSRKARNRISLFSHALQDLTKSWESDGSIKDSTQLKVSTQEQADSAQGDQLSPISQMILNEVQQFQEDQNWLSKTSCCDEQEWTNLDT